MKNNEKQADFEPEAFLYDAMHDMFLAAMIATEHTHIQKTFIDVIKEKDVVKLEDPDGLHNAENYNSAEMYSAGFADGMFLMKAIRDRANGKEITPERGCNE